MNVLILTPGRTGSSPLQRVLTTIMHYNGFDPVINFHDLLHGLDRNPNYALDMVTLSQSISDINKQDLSQSLSEVTNLIESAQHNNVGRIAYYGALKRNDTVSEQKKFFQFLNDNFYIIRTERSDLFEFALSWEIARETRQLNVHSADEKEQTIKKLDGHVWVHPKKFRKRLNDYNKYIEWTNKHFRIDANFVYEDSMHQLEEYITGLDFMPNNCKTWKDIYGISFNDWNQYHNLDYQRRVRELTNEEVGFMFANGEAYDAVSKSLGELVDMGILATNIPIKLQTGKEKQDIVYNYDSCVMWYNQWLKS